MGMFAVVKDNKVVGVFNGQKFGEGRNCVDLPDDCAIFPGSDVREYDAAWNLRPLSDRVKEGLVKISPRHEVVGEEIIPKSLVKLVLEGLEELPAGYKLVPEAEAPKGVDVVDGYALRQLLPLDLIEAGLIDPPKGTKFVIDAKDIAGYRVEALTDAEQAATGIITEQECRRREIVDELASLDRIISREVEDFYKDSNKTPSLPVRAEAIKRKEELRAELKTL